MDAPSSTYRLMLRPGFTLDDAAALLDYLVALGVGAVYLSPVLTSTTGSDHGYDVTDPTGIDPQRGGEDGFSRFLAAAEQAGLPVIADIVPNHVGVAVPEENPAWWDVLTHGRQSPYAPWFDIDWTAEKLLLPVLGDGADEESALRIADGRLCYWEHRFPIAPGTAGGSPAEVHDRQHYRLVNHRLAQSELGYRRFFAVSSLAGIRVEDAAVFQQTHTRIARMIDQGVAGLRVDHPDGLAAPGEYLQRLRELAPGTWIWVEKILEPGEQLPDWPVAGTTGYDALADLTGVFVDPGAGPALTEIYRRHTGDRSDAAGHARTGKELVLDTLFGSELRRLARLVPGVPDAREVFRTAAVEFDVYRSYLPDGAPMVAGALDRVRRQRPELAGAVAALRPLLLDAEHEVAIRFQQLTGAVMAKGVEDTAFYRYNRLLALNEVGGDPDRFGRTPEEFHSAAAQRLHRHPDTMTALSTHDTKRSEDVRAAIAVLAELPEEWDAFCRELAQRAPMPEPTTAYLLWQTLAAVGLIDRDRLHAFAEKAIREAAVGTGWLDPDQAFEDAVHAALNAIYDDPETARLVTDFHHRIRVPALANQLGQKLLQIVGPGVPDVYQGTEFVDDSLVDPDNRRPVDFAVRRRRLAEAEASGGPDAGDPDGVKLWLTSRALRARWELAGRFSRYRPLTASGPAAAHLIGVDRGPLVGLATRLPVGLAAAGGWRNTSISLPVGDWTEQLTGRRLTGSVPVGELLDRFPVAVLTRTDTRP